MMLGINAVMNEYINSVCKNKQSRPKLKKSPVAGTRIHVEPDNGSRRQLTDEMDELSNN